MIRGRLMITDAIINLAMIVASWFVSLLPGDLPDWLATSVTGVATLVSQVLSWTVWIPWQALKVIVIGLFAFWLIVFLVKLTLKIWSFIPFIGGTA